MMPDDLEIDFFNAALLRSVDRSLGVLVECLGNLARIADSLEQLVEMTKVAPR